MQHYYSFLDEDIRQDMISEDENQNTNQTMITIFENDEPFFPENDPELEELMDSLGDSYSEGVWLVDIDDIDMISAALDAHGLIKEDNI